MTQLSAPLVNDSEVLRFRRVSNRPPVRVGIMLDTYNAPAWIAHVIRQFRAAPFIEIVGVVMNRRELEASTIPTDASWFGKLRRLVTGKTRLKGALWALYLNWDNAHFPLDDDPFAATDIKELVSDVPTLVVEPIGKKIVHRFSEEDLAVIRGWNLDVFVRFGFNILKGAVLQSARYGVWSYHHGDNQVYRGGPAHFWELYHQHPLSGVILQVLTEELDGGKVIYKSWSATQQGVSLKKNRYIPYWKASAFLLRRLYDLHERGWDWFSTLPTWNEPLDPASKIYRAPTNTQMALFLARNAGRTIKRRLLYSHIQKHWFIAIRQDRAKFVRNTSGGIDMAGFRPILPPRGHFYADPFAFKWRGRNFILFEDYVYGAEKGRISAIEIGPDGAASAPEVALERPYHLAYPCVFEHQGEIYMIPETMANRTVELYRAVDFPRKWELARVLQSDIRACDVTFLSHEGTCYFFATVIERGAAFCDELFVFFSDSLTGPWESHPANPVCSDVRRARSAGHLFYRGDRLIRPSQDCSIEYGYACQLNEVVTLSRSEYRERPAGVILPTWRRGLKGTHTLNSTEDLEVIDGMEYVPRRKVV